MDYAWMICSLEFMPCYEPFCNFSDCIKQFCYLKMLRYEKLCDYVVIQPIQGPMLVRNDHDM